MLTMVFIRAALPGAVKQLRSMHLDIVRVRPDPERPADENSLAGPHSFERGRRRRDHFLVTVFPCVVAFR